MVETNLYHVLYMLEGNDVLSRLVKIGKFWSAAFFHFLSWKKDKMLWLS